MKIFYTVSTQHLAENISLPYGKVNTKKFCDGEIYLKVDEDVKSKECWVIASTESNNEINFLELFFLLDALQRLEPKKINLFFTYFGYARQDRINKPGESLSAQVVSNCLKQFKIDSIYILHAHSKLLHNFLKFEQVMPDKIYLDIISKDSVIVAPDEGAMTNCQKLAQEKGCAFAWLEKHRPEHEKVEVLRLNGNVKNKRAIIVDDMISTGSTILKAAEFLMNNGAKSVEVIATHGIWCTNSFEKINGSSISRIYVTNSIKQPKENNKLQVLAISNFLRNFIQQAR